MNPKELDFGDVMLALGGVSTESELSNLGLDYVVAHISGVLGDFEGGAVIVACADGLWAIPYDRFDASKGFEWLDMKQAVSLSGEMADLVASNLEEEAGILAKWAEKVRKHGTLAASKEDYDIPDDVWNMVGGPATDALETAAIVLAEQLGTTRKEALRVIYETVLQRWDVMGHEKS